MAVKAAEFAWGVQGVYRRSFKNHNRIPVEASSSSAV